MKDYLDTLAEYSKCVLIPTYVGLLVILGIIKLIELLTSL
jgi:hypothetical protein